MPLPLLPLAVGAAAVTAAFLAARRRSTSTGQAQKSAPPSKPAPTAPQDGAGTNHAPYGVFDEDGTPIDTAFSAETAQQIWQEKTDGKGSIYELAKKEDITPDQRSVIQQVMDEVLRFFGRKKVRHKPRRPPVMEKFVSEMSPQEARAVAHDAAQGAGRHTPSIKRSIDLDFLARCLEQVLQLDLPCFRVARKVLDEDFDLIPIKKREQRVRKREVLRPAPQAREKHTIEERDVPYPADDMDVRRIRSVSELRRVRPRALIALPQQLLGKRLVERELMVTQHIAHEPHTELEQVTAQVPITVDEPYVHEWTEQMKVPKAPSGQLMVMVVDVSGSVSSNGYRQYLAMALLMAVVRRGIDNSSRYITRLFADRISPAYSGLDKAGKERLLRQLPALVLEADLGSGTQVIEALEYAANDIRKIRSEEDRPEVLLITDGDFGLEAQDILRVLGTDVILHTVNIGIPNAELKAHSSTCSHLSLWNTGKVTVV